MKQKKQQVETHTANYCLDCGNANQTTDHECPKCGSLRHRAYLKPGELKRFKKVK